jgi:GT2 family glycosyltransferase
LKAGGFDSVILRHGWDDLDYGLRLLALGLKPKRLVKEAFVWHYEGDYSKENIHKFFKKRYREGQLGVLFYRKHPTFEIKMMVMAAKPFYWLGKLLFKEEYLMSDAFYSRIENLIGNGKVDQAIALVRVNGYCFYLKGVEEKVKEDGYLLKKSPR